MLPVPHLCKGIIDFLQVWLSTAVVKALITWHLQILLHYLVSRVWLEVILVATPFTKLGAASAHLLCRGDSTVTAQRKVAFPWKISGVSNKKLEYGERNNIWHPVSLVIVSVQTNRPQAGSKNCDGPAVQLGDELYQCVWQAGLTLPWLRYHSDRVCINPKIYLLEVFFTLLYTYRFFYSQVHKSWYP